MSDCPNRGRLVDYFYGELDERARSEVERHLQACAACAAELGCLDALRVDLEALPIEPLSDERVRAMLLVAEAERPLGERIASTLRTNLEPLERVFLPMLLGLGTCFLTLAPIVLSGTMPKLSPEVLLVCGVLWASIYNSIIGTLLDAARHRDGHLRLRVVLYGVLVAMLFMHLFYYAGLKWALLPKDLGLKLAGSMTVCSALALLFVGVGVGFMVDRRSLPNMVLVLVLYLVINLPSLHILGHLALSVRSVADLAAPVAMAGLAGLILGRFAKEARGRIRAARGAAPQLTR